jgi:hypothetical protein
MLVLIILIPCFALVLLGYLLTLLYRGGGEEEDEL